MKTHYKVTLAVLILMFGWISYAPGQATNKPYNIEIHVGDSIYRPGRTIVLPLGTPEVRVIIQNVGGNSASRFITKKVTVSSPRNIGSSQNIAAFDIDEKDGSNFPVSNGMMQTPSTITYSLEGITEIREGRSKPWKVPLRERTFTIQYVR